MDRSGNAVKPKENGRYICEIMINFISKAKELDDKYPTREFILRFFFVFVF